MKDYEGDLPKNDERVMYRGENYVKIGPRKPYNELLCALRDYARVTGTTHAEREALRKLAWFLGETGQRQACELIMEYAVEPERRSFMYGIHGV